MAYVFGTEAKRFSAHVIISEAEVRHTSLETAVAHAKERCADIAVRTAVAKHAKVETPTAMRPDFKVTLDVYILTADQMSELVENVYQSAMRDAVKFNGRYS